MPRRTPRTFVPALAAVAAFCALLVTTPSVHSRAPVTIQDQRDLAIQQNIESIVARARGRVGVAAADLDGGGEVLIHGDMPFPMASTVKIAVAGTFLTGVEQGRYRLDQSLPMMMPVAERGARSAQAPVRPGPVMSAQQLMELMITRSDNHATDGLISAVGGVSAVNAWLAPHRNRRAARRQHDRHFGARRRPGKPGNDNRYTQCQHAAGDAVAAGGD